MSGISNAPGTRTTVMSSVDTSACSSVSSAPCRRPAVISSLKRDTTTANRHPAAWRLPCSSISAAGRPLLSLERRLPLVEKRAGPFAHVGGGEGKAEQRCLEEGGLFEWHLGAALDRLDDVPGRDGRLRREIAGQGTRARHQFRSRDDAVDEG